MEIPITEHGKWHDSGDGFASVDRSCSERYIDMETGRRVVVGRHERLTVMIPFDIEEDAIVPVTVHAITRQQIRFRLKAGRFSHE